MEDQTRFELSRAIENWRKELAGQSDLAPEEWQELEQRLRGSITELSGHGLSDEDVFWLACRRVDGQLDAVEERTGNAPGSVWGQRVFWIALAVLGVLLWQQTSACLAALAPPVPRRWLEMLQGKAGWTGQLAVLFLPVMLNTLPIILLAVVLLKAKSGKWGNLMLQPLLRSRRRLALVTSVATLLVVMASEYALFVVNATIPSSFLPEMIVRTAVHAIALPATFIALAVWLFPRIRPPAPAKSKSGPARNSGFRALPRLATNRLDFCLDAAMAGWRSVMTAQPGLTPEIRRELETHLRDSLTELQHLGLNVAEAFLLARWKLGQPQALDEEFARADLARVWRGRMFWIATVLLGVYFWETFWESRWPSLMLQRLNNGMEQSWMNYYLPAWVSGWLGTMSSWLRDSFFCTLASVAPIAWLAVRLVQGHISKLRALLDFVFKSRSRFLMLSVDFVIIYDYLLVSLPAGTRFEEYWLPMMFYSVWPLSLVILIAWFLPDRKSSGWGQAH